MRTGELSTSAKATKLGALDVSRSLGAIDCINIGARSAEKPVKGLAGQPGRKHRHLTPNSGQDCTRPG
jgi:hypothetical protein